MRRLKAFVSSTILELQDERLIVRDTLRIRNIDTFIFELDTGARPESVQEAYLAEVTDADLYIGIFWNQYSRATVEEFQYARGLNKPCLIYLKDFDVHRETVLQNFIDEVSHVIAYRTFRNVLELAQFVAQDVQDWLVREWRREPSPNAAKIPNVRLWRLKNDASELIEFCERVKHISICELEGKPPMRYVINYQLKGIIGVDENDDPKFSQQHLVEFVIRDGFPAELPFTRFKTPIFHPNIWKSGQVCIGWFSFPCSLTELCIHVAKMIDYQVLNLHSPSNREAVRWAERHLDLLPLTNWKPPEVD